MFKRTVKNTLEEPITVFYCLLFFKHILDLIKTRIRDSTLITETETLLKEDTEKNKHTTATISMRHIPPKLMDVLNLNDDTDDENFKDELLSSVGEAHLLCMEFLSKKQNKIMSKYRDYFSKIIHSFEMNPGLLVVNEPDMGTLTTQASTTHLFSTPNCLATASMDAQKLMTPVIKPRHVDVMDRREQPPGLIISTQSPAEDSNTQFPRPGGTAFAIQKITKHPCIKMHRDAKARPLEASLFSKLKHNSIIFITGHGNSASDFLGGVYTRLGAEDDEKNQYLQWSIEDYANLIIENSSLKENDLVTIVLWVCYAGNKGVDSTAVQLGRILRDEGLHVRIIASIAPLSRFDGTYEDDEAESSRLRFRTHQESIRIFDCSDAGIIEYKNKNKLYFTDQGIVGYSPIDPLFIDGASLKDQVRSSDLFIKNGNRDAAITSLIKNKQNRCYVLTDSDIKVKGYHPFTMSLKTTKTVAHLEFLIKGNELWSYYQNQKNQIQLLPDGIFFTLEQQIIQQEQKKIVFIPIAEKADYPIAEAASADTSLNSSEMKRPNGKFDDIIHGEKHTTDDISTPTRVTSSFFSSHSTQPLSSRRAPSIDNNRLTLTDIVPSKSTFV